MISRLRAFTTRLRSSSVARNAAALYVVHLTGYLLPLITIPYLARTLGASSWGVIAIAQGLAAYGRLVVEYGFNLSATRDIAKHRTDRTALAQTLASVISARCILSVLVVGLGLLVGHAVPTLRANPVVIWMAIALALTQGYSMMWFFQGLERMRTVAVLDVTAKAIAVIGILVWVKRPDDNWIVLALYAAAAGGASLTAMVMAWREVGLGQLGLRAALHGLRAGWSMFVYRGSVSTYTVGNAFLLGLFVAPQYVAYYAGAEKLSQVASGVLNPITQALFPRISGLVRDSREKAAEYVRVSLRLMTTGGLLVGTLLFVTAPFAVQVMLGPDFAPAVVAVRLLALLPPLIAVSNVLGVQWMVPLGHDRVFNSIIVSAGLVNLTLVLLLTPSLAHVGMAVAVVVTEVFVTSVMIIVLKARGMSPFARGKRAPKGLSK